MSSLGIVSTALTALAGLFNYQKRNLSDVKDATKTVLSITGNMSMSEITRLTSVEPLTILSKDCLNLGIMPDLNQALLSIFCGYYVRTMDLIGNVKNVEVVRALDKLNPDRSNTGFLLQTSLESSRNLSLESFQHTLTPTKGLALETSNETLKSIAEISNLSVGKLINVEISSKDDSQSFRIPVNVRLAVSALPNESVSHILAYQTEDRSLTERFHAWRAGRISFIKDLVFCRDLIDEYKRAVIKDNTDTIQEIMRRVSNSKKYGLLTNNPSLATASNIFVLTENVARDLELKLGGKLSNPKIREKAFDNTYAMLIVEIDRERERVIIYTHGIAAASDFSFKEIKAAAKNKGPDILDIMKSMNLGTSVNF
jgi:hypothetical protein